ncbi:MAG: tetratricopeptide repeat protein [Sedimentisphaerales bacterium]
MKKWLPLITVVFLVILSDTIWSIENTAIRSPILSGTAPPTSIRSGLIQSRNPIDTTGNLVITGNTIGGRHFRALVPYGSTTSFRATAGSSSLDSFLRYSADLQDVGPYTDGYGPYYAPTGTVTIARPGQPGIFMPTMTRIRTRAGYLGGGVSTDELAMPGGQVTSDRDTSAFQMSLRPMSRTPQELEKVISDELGGVLPPHEALRYLRAERLPLTQSGSEQYQDRTRQFQRSPLEVRSNVTTAVPNNLLLTGRGLKPIAPDLSRAQAAELKQSPAAETLYAKGRDSPAAAGAAPAYAGGKRGHEGQTSLVYRPSSVVPAFPQTRPTLQDQQSTSGGAVFRSGRAELDELIRAAEKKAQGLLRSGLPKKTPMQTEKQLNVYEQIKSRTNYLPAQDADSLSPWRLGTDSISAGLDDLIKPDTSAASRLRSKPAEGDERKRYGQTRSTAARLTTPYLMSPTPRSYGDAAITAGKREKSENKDQRTGIECQDRFNWYIKAAQVYLKQGRYYRAVDAYTMASIYKLGPAGSLRQREAAGLAYIGKSQALFAAGEYISSALFLSRALAVMPEYASFKVDFVDILGGQDKLEKRIVDAEQRLKISDAAELQFLLGYIYYQLAKAKPWTGSDADFVRLDEAKKAIDVAFQKLPDSKAVSAVKKAIDEARRESQMANRKSISD